MLLQIPVNIDVIMVPDQLVIGNNCYWLRTVGFGFCYSNLFSIIKFTIDSSSFELVVLLDRQVSA